MHVFTKGLNGFTFIVTIGLALTLAGCGGKKKSEDQTAAPNALDADRTGQMGDSDSNNAMGLQTVSFAYDSYVLGSNGKRTLDQNIAVMKDKASLKVQIEGHCDERGGIQYNLALGEKRADVARKYMIDKGISGDRVTTISFGKERPVDDGHTEAAWAKNRRANFVITGR